MPPRSAGTDLKAACALLEAGTARGTGFLVSSERLLTCNHVIKEAGDAGVLATFSHGQYEARVEFVDEENDCALLRLSRAVLPDAAQPLVLASIPVEKGASWEGYGFPAATGQAGLLIDGRVQDPTGQDPALLAAVVLQSANVTAGSWLQGFSGSPVMVRGMVVGQMRKIIPNESGGAQMAVIYACPVSVLANIDRRGPGAGRSPRPNPYRGLSSFRPEDAQLFFGREELTQKLWQRFRTLYETAGAARLLAVLGPSGSGKSSAALAGLVPELGVRPVPGPAPLRVILLQPGNRPLESLARALVSHLRPDTSILPASRQVAIEKLLRDKSVPGEGLRRFAADLPDIAAAPIAVVVDQFEEVYTLCTESAERDIFVDTLLHAARDANRSVAVVLTLRTDFLGETQRQHSELNRAIAAQHELVPAMSRDELRRAISEPARQAGRPLEEPVVELLLSQAHGSEGALPLLEFALTRIWEGLTAGDEPAATLQASGGVGGALAQQAHRLYERLSAAEQRIAQRAFVRMVQLGEGTRDTRRRVALSELCGQGETEGHVLAVLRTFADERARLVTLSASNHDENVVTAEVTHEALFEHWTVLRQWIDENRADRRFHDRVTEAARLWNEAGRPSGRLWRTPDLDLIRSYQQRRPDELGPLQVAFLRSSLRQQRREKVLSLGSLIAIALSILISGGTYIIKERQRTRELAEFGERIRQALLSAYVEQARQNLVEKHNPDEALLYLQRSYHGHAQTPFMLDLLRNALWGFDATQAVLLGHADRILSASFSPDGNRIVTASLDKTAAVWEAVTGRFLFALKEHGDRVVSARYSPDGGLIVTTSWDQTARIWDAVNGTLRAELTGHTGGVWNAEFSPDGRSVITASQDKTARVWDVQTGKPIGVLQGHSDQVLAAKYSPDGRLLVTASSDDVARIWDAKTRSLLRELKGHKERVFGAVFSPDSHQVVTTSQDKTARAWDAETGRWLVTLTGHGAPVESAAYSPDGKRIVTASWDRTARVWDAQTGGPIAVLTGHGDRVVSAVYSPDGHNIITASLDKTARLWEPETGKLLAEFIGHSAGIWTAAYSPDGRLIVTASLDKTARVWKAEASRLSVELSGHADSILSAAYSPDGRHIVSASADKTARVWEASTGALRLELKGHSAGVLSAAYSPDGRSIVTASADKTARVWAADTGRLRAELLGHGDVVWSARYSPDGTRIVTAGQDRTVRIWESETGRSLLTFAAHSDRTLWATYSPDGHQLVTSGWENNAKLWEAETGRLLNELKGHSDAIQSAAYSPDGRHIVTASQDQTARLWDARDGRQLAVLKGHTATVTSAAYSPDGYRILTASKDRTIRVWEADTGRLLTELRGHGASVLSATYSRHGDRIVSASEDNTARIWDVAPEARSAQEIDKIIRCYVPIRFESAESSFIIPSAPEPAACQNHFAPFTQ